MARRLERRRRHGWGFLTELHDKGVDLFLHQQGTSTTSGKALASLRPRRCSTSWRREIAAW